MTLIVEDGTALSTAESYISLADANQYHENRGNAAWVGEDWVKEAALRRAADYMAQMYRMRWLGTRVKVDQALDWPRIGVVLDDVNAFVNDRGYYFNVQSNVIPIAVMQANAILALKTLAFDDSGNPYDLAPDLQRQTHREKVGSLEVEYEPGSVPYVRFRAVDKLLGIYLNGGPAGIKLVRG